MAKKKQRKNQASNISTAINLNHEKVFPSPFRELKALLKQLPHGTIKKPHVNASHIQASPASSNHSGQKAGPSSEESAEELFRKAMEGVRPLEDRDRSRRPVTPPAQLQIVDEDAEALAELCELVAGNRSFDIMETDEYVEGARVGLDPRVMRKLKRGEFAIQAHLDLHGMTREQAKEALSEFITCAVRNGHQSVLVVSGRGLRSPGGQPVLKRAVTHWLSHGRLSAHVLAFVTARPTDGGSGALYVLLRRQRRKASFRVLESFPK